MQNLYETNDVKKFVSIRDAEHYLKTGFAPDTRSVWCGPSGCGKSNGVANYILKSNGFYEQIVVVSAGVEEPLYQSLLEKLEKHNCIRFFDIDSLPTLAELALTKPKDEQWLVIFDDLLNQMVGKNARKVRDYFTMMRKYHMDGMFLTQSMHDTDSIIRKNVEYACVFALNGKRDTNIVLSDFNTAGENSNNMVRQMYSISTEERGNFLKVDRRERSLVKKYSRNFTDYFNVNDYRGMQSLEIPPWYKGEDVIFEEAQHKEGPKKRKAIESTVGSTKKKEVKFGDYKFVV